ncbi:MAG: DUF3577 domain-containing protein [Vicinamibacterales bacterium]
MSQDNASKYFDLTVEGVGYLNRVREVRPRDGDPFLVCTISALRGAQGNVQYTTFDCRVTGKEARERVRLLQPFVNAERTVLLGFRVGDIFPETFTFEKGERQGQQGLTIRARLLKVKFAKVDGQSLYSADIDRARSSASVPA